MAEFLDAFAEAWNRHDVKVILSMMSCLRPERTQLPRHSTPSASTRDVYADPSIFGRKSLTPFKGTGAAPDRSGMAE
jgi:hypothetical protein